MALPLLRHCSDASTNLSVKQERVSKLQCEQLCDGPPVTKLHSKTKKHKDCVSALPIRLPTWWGGTLWKLHRWHWNIWCNRFQSNVRSSCSSDGKKHYSRDERANFTSHHYINTEDHELQACSINVWVPSVPNRDADYRWGAFTTGQWLHTRLLVQRIYQPLGPKKLAAPIIIERTSFVCWPAWLLSRHNLRL